jgi:Shugoshin N-terminal coiled-coil region
MLKSRPESLQPLAHRPLWNLLMLVSFVCAIGLAIGILEAQTKMASLTVKRRFVRQNREIARVNSTQSMRIRNLEAETSRLLSENITLREVIIKLETNADRDRHRYALENLETVKSQLNDKVKELSELITGIGTYKHPRTDSRGSRRLSKSSASPKRSPRNWKNTFSLSEVTGTQEGHLPSISEDAYVNRKPLQ